MNKEKVLWGLVIVALLLSGLAYRKAGVPGPKGEDGKVLGSTPTLDGIDSPYAKINGLGQYYYTQPMMATSSVLCSIQNPFKATSTLLNYSAVITGNGSAPQVADLSTSTNAFASTSPALMRGRTFAGLDSFFWTPTNPTSTDARTIGLVGASGDNTMILGPSDYVNLRIATSTPTSGIVVWRGRCSGVIQKLF